MNLAVLNFKIKVIKMKQKEFLILFFAIVFLTANSSLVSGQSCPGHRDDALLSVEIILKHPQFQEIRNETGLQLTSIEEVTPVTNESVCQQLQSLLRVNGGDLGPQLTRTDLIPFFYKTANRYFISYEPEKQPGLDPETGHYRISTGWSEFYVLDHEFNVLGRYMI